MRKTIAASFLAGLLAISSSSPAAGTQAVASVRTPAAAPMEATVPQGGVPLIAVAPTRIEAVGDPGGPPVSVELTISNSGEADLVWDASEASGGQATASTVVQIERVGERWPLAGPQQRATFAADHAVYPSPALPAADIPAVTAGASVPAGTEECGPSVEGILIVDDGTPDNGLAQQRTVVQRFTPSFHPATFTNVCVSFYRTRPTPVPSASFEVSCSTPAARTAVRARSLARWRL